jgi:hypothetical protein
MTSPLSLRPPLAVLFFDAETNMPPDYGCFRPKRKSIQHVYSVGLVLKAQASRTYSVSMADYTCTPKGNDVDFPCPFSTISKWRNLSLPRAGPIRSQRNGPSIFVNYSAMRGDMSKSRNCDSARTYFSKHPMSSRALMIRDEPIENYSAETRVSVSWSAKPSVRWIARQLIGSRQLIPLRSI